MEWLPDAACTETLDPRRQELREAAEQNSPEEPSLHGEGAIDSRDEFGAEKATRRPLETPKPTHKKLQPRRGFRP